MRVTGDGALQLDVIQIKRGCAYWYKSTWQKGENNPSATMPTWSNRRSKQSSAILTTVLRWGKEMAGRVGMGGGIVAVKKNEGLFILPRFEIVCVLAFLGFFILVCVVRLSSIYALIAGHTLH